MKITTPDIRHHKADTDMTIRVHRANDVRLLAYAATMLLGTFLLGIVGYFIGS